uniref:Putative lectin/glucanase superfamily protein n=2 Tax=viral metagenome TaxID=1070528 RepID=A0A6M3IKG4_9ZZZZ
MRKLSIFILLFILVSSAQAQLRVESEQTYINLTPSELTAYKSLSFLNGDSYAISSGSAIGDAVSLKETFDSNQGTLEFWYYPYNYGNAGQTRYLFECRSVGSNYIQVYIGANNYLYFIVMGNGTQVFQLASGYQNTIPFQWYHIVATWSKSTTVSGSRYVSIYLNGAGAGSASVPVAMTSIPSNFYIGSNYLGTQSANGLIAYKISDYWTSAAQVTANYNSGNGNKNFFLVDPHTVAMGLTSESSTGVQNFHRGASVSSIVDGATEDTLTVATDASKRFADNDVVVVSANQGYSSQRIAKIGVDGTPSATSMNVDDLAGGDAGLVEKIGVFATLNGSSQYLTKTSPTNITWDDDYTVSIWAKTTSTAERCLYQKNSTGVGVKLSQVSNVAFAAMRNTASGDYIFKTGTKIINDGKWHHVAVTYDNAPTPTLCLYIDGYLDVSSTTTFGTADLGVNGTLFIGNRGFVGDQYFNGSIQDVMVWTSLLTPANILTLAQNPHSENGLAPQSWWIFDDASGATTIADQATAGNNNHLTMVGGTTTNFSTHSRVQSAMVSRNLIVDGNMEQ